jgi:hypothetical protein
MGKAADNGRIALRAAFYNNLAVTALVAGGAIPFVIALAHQAPLSQDDVNCCSS